MKVKRADFAKINFWTMGNNLSHGFVWNNDQFSTNLLGHPYHGGLYFNAARINGVNFWQSVPYTVAGSLMWEYLMENEPPSINDFIATPIGGMALGEMTFRLSGLLIDNRATVLNLNTQGDRGNMNLSFDYCLKKRYVFSLETSYYLHDSYYRYFPKVEYQIVESKIGIGYLF
jgi:hypothetical protein